MRQNRRIALIALSSFVFGAAIATSGVLGVQSAQAETAAPYVSGQCYEAALISRDYNRTADHAERASLYEAYLAASGTCLSYARP